MGALKMARLFQATPARWAVHRAGFYERARRRDGAVRRWLLKPKANRTDEGYMREIAREHDANEQIALGR